MPDSEQNETVVPDLCTDPNCKRCARRREDERARLHGSFGREWFDSNGDPIWDNVT